MPQIIRKPLNKSISCFGVPGIYEDAVDGFLGQGHDRCIFAVLSDRRDQHLWDELGKQLIESLLRDCAAVLWLEGTFSTKSIIPVMESIERADSPDNTLVDIQMRPFFHASGESDFVLSLFLIGAEKQAVEGLLGATDPSALCANAQSVLMAFTAEQVKEMGVDASGRLDAIRRNGIVAKAQSLLIPMDNHLGYIVGMEENGPSGGRLQRLGFQVRE